MSITEINLFSCQRLLNVSSTAATLVAFGFPAQYVRVDNLGAVDMFLTPSAGPTANAPSTDNYSITSCAGSNRASWEYWAPPVSTRTPTADMTLQSISLTTTSTSGGGQKVAVLAMG